MALDYSMPKTLLFVVLGPAAQLNPGFGGNNYPPKLGYGPAFFDVYRWVSVGFGGLCCPFVGFWCPLVGFGNAGVFFVGIWCFFDGVWCFLGVPRCFRPLALLSVFFSLNDQNVELFYSLNSKAPNNYLN